MKHPPKRLMPLLLIILSWLVINIALVLSPLLTIQAPVYAFSFIAQATPSVNPTPTPGPSPDAQFGFYGALLAALVSALLAGIFGFLYIKYQARKNKEVQALQDRNQELQRRLDAAAHRRQLEEDIGKQQYAAMLTARQDAQDRERQRRENVQAIAKSVMVQAHTPAEREAAYRKALLADPQISQLQVLDMTHPMNVADVYVRLRLHQETKLGYEVDAALLAAEKREDPNSLMRARFAYVQTRTQAAMTPEQALQKYPRCIVLGDPGAGKSTLLKYLTLQAINGQLPNLPHFPIHIALSDFATSPQQDLIAFAAERWYEWYGFPESEARTLMESRLADGSAMLLLDALDETVIGVSDEAARESYSRVLEAIDRVATRYRKEVPIVVTARKAGYYRRAHMSGFTELEVLDFRPEEIKEFVINWFKYHPTPPKYATADALNIQLANNPRMQSLATNPLLLCLIVMVYEDRQDLPQKRADIYKQCIDTLLYRWDTTRDLRRRRKFEIEDKKDLLAEIAWHFHLQGRRYFPEDELLQVIAAFSPTVGLLAEDSKAILNEIEEENGLLKEQAHGWHGFLHLTLQEYFVAQRLGSIQDGQNELLKHCGDPWWEEVLTLYAGSVYDANPLLQALLKQEKSHWPWQDVFHTSLVWAGQCLTAKPRRVQPSLRTEILTSLFTLLRKIPYSLTQDQIVKILMGIEGSDARDKLLQLLKDKQEDSEVRGSVAEALGALGERSVVGELLAVLKDRQQNLYVRESVAEALGALGERSVVSELLAMLKDRRENRDVRWNVARTLGVLGERSVVDELLAIFKDQQENSYVRESVAGALGQLGEHSVVGELLTVLKDRQEDYSVRESVAGALGQLGERSVVGELLTLLRDKQEDSDVRWSVPRALGQLGERSVVGELLTVLKDRQEDRSVRGYVARAIGTLGERSVVGELLTVLKDKQESSYVRGYVAEALGVLGERSVVGELLTVLKDRQEDRSVRVKVAQVLLKFEQHEAVLPYLRLIVEYEANRRYSDRSSMSSEYVWNFASIRAFAQLLRHAEYAPTRSAAHRMLWAACQRERVHILMFEWWFVEFVRVVRR